jgi:hypothetical protein
MIDEIVPRGELKDRIALVLGYLQPAEKAGEAS